MKPYRALIVTGLTLLAACAQQQLQPVSSPIRDVGKAGKESTGVTITGVQHLGPNFSVEEFAVDDYSAGSVGRGGGGGSFVCCVRLPDIWRPDLKVEVRWEVADWSSADVNETEKGNFSSVRTAGIYKAVVPVEYYSSAENLYVHFFSGGRVRVVSTLWPPSSAKHPVSRKQPDLRKAGQGVKIKSMYESSK